MPPLRFRIRTLMMAVAVVAVAFGWFKLFALTAAVVTGAAITLGAIFSTTGRVILAIIVWVCVLASFLT